MDFHLYALFIDLKEEPAGKRHMPDSLEPAGAVNLRTSYSPGSTPAIEARKIIVHQPASFQIALPTASPQNESGSVSSSIGLSISPKACRAWLTIPSSVEKKA